ncbi:MAG: hypothetical protein NTU57_02465 [Candidatus Aenigmarchaeota archaeon]|nr:hypothetical protein [Candidatus Aenigmarchaeota archaeon]
MKKPFHSWHELGDYFSAVRFGKYTVCLNDESCRAITTTYRDKGPRIEFYGNPMNGFPLGFCFPEFRENAEETEVAVKSPLSGLRISDIGSDWADFTEGPVPMEGRKFHLKSGDIKRITKEPGFLRRIFGAAEKEIYVADNEQII